MSIQHIMAYVMIGMGIGVLVQAAGGTQEIAIAIGVALVCVIALVKNLIFKDSGDDEAK